MTAQMCSLHQDAPCILSLRAWRGQCLSERAGMGLSSQIKTPLAPGVYLERVLFSTGDLLGHPTHLYRKPWVSCVSCVSLAGVLDTVPQLPKGLKHLY